MSYNPMQWHEHATQAGFLAGVADDHVNAALRGFGLTPAEIAQTLDKADAALCSALRELTQARAQAVTLRDMMEEL